MSACTCAHCGGTFEQGWSDEEARAEQHREFPGIADATCEVICDDCYREFQAWRAELSPEEEAELRAEALAHNDQSTRLADDKQE